MGSLSADLPRMGSPSGMRSGNAYGAYGHAPARWAA